MNRDLPARPANFANIVAINQGRRPLPAIDRDPEPLAPGRIAGLVESGHRVLDVRMPEAFGAAHVPGSYNVQLASPEFEQRVGWLSSGDVPMILVAERPEDVRRAIELLAFVGLDRRVVGALDGGMEAYLAAGLPAASIEQVDVRALASRLAAGGGCVLDVREPPEWDAGHIASARKMSYRFLAERYDELALPAGEPIFVVCAGGWRSSTACSLLRARGFDVRNVAGGMSAWHKERLPLAGAPGG